MIKRNLSVTISESVEGLTASDQEMVLELKSTDLGGVVLVRAFAETGARISLSELETAMGDIIEFVRDRGDYRPPSQQEASSTPPREENVEGAESNTTDTESDPTIAIPKKMFIDESKIRVTRGDAIAEKFNAIPEKGTIEVKVAEIE